MNRLRWTILAIVAAVGIAGQQAEAQRRNDKMLNRPYADLHAWHLGFSVGMHTQDLHFTHNGFTTDEGQSWFMEQPAYQPGFSVNGLLDLRLSTYFNVRFTPGLYFGNRDIHFRESNTGELLKQNLKSAYLVFPVDLKFSSLRLRNVRPYVTAGLMPALDLTRKSSEYLKLKGADLYFTVGFGCDTYMPFFKFIPEVKFCIGLMDVVDHKRADLTDEPDKYKFTQSISKAVSSMMVVTFYFE